MLRNLVAVFSKRGASCEVDSLTRYLKRVVAAPETIAGIHAESRSDSPSESG
jgi:hypothetical protein